MKRILPVLTLLLSLSAAAAPARRGWTKLEFTPIDGKGPAVAADVVHGSGAEIVSDYGSFAIVSAPAAAVEGLTRAAQKRGFAVRRRDDLDLLELANVTIDVRIGLDGAPSSGLIRNYPPKKPGLFVIQFAAPARPEWLAELGAMGWQLARSVQHNGYIAIGAPELAQPTRNLPYVQWTDFHHPYQKYAPLPAGNDAQDVFFELPSGSDLSETLAQIQSRAEGTIEVQRGKVDTLVFARMKPADARALLHDPLIIAMGRNNEIALSDERQVMSLTSNLNTAQTQPTNPGGYWSWVTSSSRCPDCDTMSAADWKVGIADYGLDNGELNNGHPDLNGRKYYGLVPSDQWLCTPTTLGCDTNGHGTMVAGIIGGAPGTSRPKDSGNYYYGTGVAPRAGLFMTTFRLANFNYLSDWMADAAQNSVTIQNHSFNEYNSSTDGKYTSMSRMYDLRTRDADPNTTAREPVLFTVSAGNNNQLCSGASCLPISAGGTAKNVVTVSGLENYRSITCSTCASDGYQNIMKTSRIGTKMDSAYIKPDLVAPASAIVSAMSTSISSTPSTSGCAVETESQYHAASGTSFAAPVAAGAAILVKRQMGSTPAATSPAATKALLIAGARSVRGGEDRTGTTAVTIGAAPNTQQGFGRISLDDILTGSVKPVMYDESTSRLFTTTGQQLVGRIKVRDNTKPVKVVLVWTDAAASCGAPNPLVNNLDLEISPVNSNTTVYLGNKLSVDTTNGEVSTANTRGSLPAADDVNNVEYARFFGTANQEFDVVVKAAAISCDPDLLLCSSGPPKQDFALVAVNAEEVSALQAPPATPPQNVVATATGSTVSISWSAVSGATSYTVKRRVGSSGWDTVGTVSSSPASDVPSTSSGVVVYHVVANIGTASSAASDGDVAFVGTFTDPTFPTSAPFVPVKAVHITELRSAVNALRAMFGQSLPYSTPELDAAELSGDLILDTDFTSLMTNVNAARNSATVPGTLSFVNSVLQDGLVLQAQIEQLRNALK